MYRAISPKVPIIAISHHQASTAGSIPIAAVIHHGIEPEAFPIGAGDGGYYCWLGRMASYKGAREAIEIARRAGVPLRLAGKIEHEDEAEYFQEQVEPPARRRRRVHRRDRPRRARRLSRRSHRTAESDHLVEPFGLTMVESLACGTPVVAFPRGSVPEIVEDGVTGLLCADSDVMVDRLPEAARLDRAACRKAVEGHFSAARMVDEHLALYYQLIDARRLLEQGEPIDASRRDPTPVAGLI